jgi:hypothetical protein
MYSYHAAINMGQTADNIDHSMENMNVIKNKHLRGQSPITN